MCHLELTHHANCTKPQERRHNPPMRIDQSRLGPFHDTREGWVPCQPVLDFQRSHNECLALHPGGFPVLHHEEEIDCKECNYVVRERNHWVTFENAARVKAEPCIEVWHQCWDMYKGLWVPCDFCVVGKIGRLQHGLHVRKNPPTPEFKRVTPRD
ncbi:Calcium-transporting ATPase 3 [Venturia inaequalis]|nr:Calcium-transporting ATPase 3 [Venturia inaequalis]